ncbi:MAG TPA: hypothetical protein VMJ66_05810 [Geobacteraceae bacterium]|nr:hypothetical protein [Geobacteraceae bacterium]
MVPFRPWFPDPTSPGASIDHASEGDTQRLRQKFLSLSEDGRHVGLFR